MCGGFKCFFYCFFVLSVVSNFIWLFGNVSNFQKVVLGCCAGLLGCLHRKVVLGCFGLFNLHTSLFVFLVVFVVVTNFSLFLWFLSCSKLFWLFKLFQDVFNRFVFFRIVLRCL